VQAALARLEALEKDNAGAHEPIDLDDDDEASPDEDEQSEFLLQGTTTETKCIKCINHVIQLCLSATLH
jgi:hypothetical protein